jgi:hypothetical protein
MYVLISLVCGKYIGKYTVRHKAKENEIFGYLPLFYMMSFESSSLPDFNIVVSVPEAISLEKDI